MLMLVGMLLLAAGVALSWSLYGADFERVIDLYNFIVQFMPASLMGDPTHRTLYLMKTYISALTGGVVLLCGGVRLLR
ncbi:MAG: hypothetical protein WC817_01790 [Patescibacteria group bacterium]|jgi:hypothetical protein